MCYYSSISVGFKFIETPFGVRFLQSELYKPMNSASAFMFPLMPGITDQNPVEVSLFQCGLIPSRVMDDEPGYKVKRLALNARSETIFTKPIFRRSIISKRSLVLVDGFFEWRHKNGKRYPYYFRLVDHQPCALAGIWYKWYSWGTNEVTESFSVITTEANSLLAQIHNTRKRMLAILTRDND